MPLADVAAALLIEQAREVARHAHAPYSRFAVGAALLLTDGTTIVGTNLENASHGLTLCAETVALGTANSAGRLGDVVAIGIVGGTIAGGGIIGERPVTPCGRCRQLLHEAARRGGRDIAVFCASADGAALERHRLSALLPHAFAGDGA